MSTSEYDLLVLQYSIIQTSSLAIAAAGALQVYNYIITFDREVALFWRLPFTTASALYFGNQYFCLANALYFLLSDWYYPPGQTKESCLASLYIGWVLDLTPFVTSAAFSGLRTYALTQRAVLGVLVMILSLAPFIINWIGHSANVSVSVDLHALNECVIISGPSPAPAYIFVYTSRVPLIVADLIVLVVTWIKTYQLSRAVEILGSMSLSSILFKNGNIYAISSLLLNTAHVLITELSSPLDQAASDYTSSFSRLIEPLSGVLVSRFLMDLQEAAKAQEHRHSSWTASFTSIHFERAMGSLACVQAGHDLEDDSAEPEAVEGDGTDREDVGAGDTREAFV